MENMGGNAENQDGNEENLGNGGGNGEKRVGMRGVFTPISTFEFLGIDIHAHKILLSLPKEKAENKKTQFTDFFDEQTVTVRELRKLIRRLSSIAVTVLPFTLLCPSLEHQQIQGRV